MVGTMPWTLSAGELWPSPLIIDFDQLVVSGGLMGHRELGANPDCSNVA